MWHWGCVRGENSIRKTKSAVTRKYHFVHWLGFAPWQSSPEKLQGENGDDFWPSVSTSSEWRERSIVHAQHQCTLWVRQTERGMQVLQGEVDGHGTSKVHLTAPKEFFSSSPALLRSVHCLMCPILPGRKKAIRVSEKNGRPNSCSTDVLWKSLKWSLTSSLGAFLLGDFCLDSLRFFPLDLSFSLSLSLSRAFLSFSPSDSGEACVSWNNVIS